MLALDNSLTIDCFHEALMKHYKQKWTRRLDTQKGKPKNILFWEIIAHNMYVD